MQECREKRNICKRSKMEKREKAREKMQQTKKSELHCENLQTKGKNAKQVKQKNYDLQNK